METMIGVIGGSGIYEIDALENAEWISVDSPFGSPSDDILFGHLDGVKMAFLPRHGRGHVHSPSSINYRANIDALKRSGVSDIISVSACGSFRDEMAPGDFVIVDQFIDRTTAREKSFFGKGCVAHVSMANPTCSRLNAACYSAAKSQGVNVHMGGTYLAIEGPQFSTLAESKIYREQWGADVIGMTNMPEAKLAREAEICYASIAMVTDYDSWHPNHGEIDISKIMTILSNNALNAKSIITRLPKLLSKKRHDCPNKCDKSLEFALITAPEKRDAKYLKMLDAIAGRVL